MGLFGSYEQVFKARFNEGSDVTRLQLEGYGLTLSGAYGIPITLSSGSPSPARRPLPKSTR